MENSIKQPISAIVDDILSGMPIDYSTARALSGLKGADLWDLLAAANRIREHYRGTAINMCSIVNAKSGACSEDCSYCAQSVHHATGAAVYPLISIDRIAEAAASAKRNGARRFCIVTSGRGIDSSDDMENIAKGIHCVRDIGLSACATLGTLTKDQLAFLKDSGLDRYHHNIETSREYFPSICSTHSFDDRVEVLESARLTGLSVCSGGIFGMGESIEDRIKMAFTLRELQVDSVPINFLMPISGTPLQDAIAITPLEGLHSLALFRFILPEKEIRVCGGRGPGLGRLHPLIFAAGADGFMIGNYLTKAGLNPVDDLAMLRELGLDI